MIGKIINYNDNTDAYTIIGNDGNRYYGFGNFNLGDIVVFDYYLINPGEYETKVANNINLYNKKFVLKKI